MALIECKNCGKQVSDKARSCPVCGKILIEDEPIKCLICEECGSEIPEDADACPNCGCPVPVKEEVAAPQKVEVTKVSMPVDKKKVKTIVGIIIGLVVIIAAVIVGVAVSKHNKAEQEATQAAQTSMDYRTNMIEVSSFMLDGAAKAESAASLIVNVWRDSINGEYHNQDTKKYVSSDFNKALSNLFNDTDFMVEQFSIKANQETVNEIMKQLVNPPEEHSEAYSALRDYYDAYNQLVNLAINPTGSLQTYSQAFNEADSNVLNCYNTMKLYID